MDDIIEIPLSKKKILLILFGAIVFVILGVFFVLYPEVFLSTRNRSSTFITLVGIASVAFFGLCFVYAAIKIFDKKPGLKIDQFGITDNSGGLSVGLVEWQDIKDIGTLEIGSQKFVTLIIDKPEKYIFRSKNTFSRQAMRSNNKNYGSPIVISPIAMKIKADEFENMIRREFDKRNQ